jgi:sugar-specific transcriptional regulator TrmB
MKKSVKQILAEEAKRFRQLSEYSFIGINEADDENQDAEGGDLEAELDTLGAELQDKAPESGDDSEFGGAIPDIEDEPETEAPEAADDMSADPMMDSGDEVEVDVTDLVNTSNELKTSSIETNQKMADLIDKFNSLSDQITKMSKLGQNIEVLDKKIKDVETEIVRRNPTPTEKIEMRSLDSFPYNIKLSDFWSDNADKLSVEPEQDKPKEYVLTKADVDDYSDSDIRKSFSEFEEEDI